jgi:glycosyltransferase involved in cell wall biosynthesis
MNRIRVAHVITRLCKGGAQENTFHTVRLTDRNRFDVSLITGPTFGHEGSIEDTVRDAGIAIEREAHLVRPVSPLEDAYTVRCLARRFRRDRPYIVHTHTSKAGMLGRAAARLANVPIVVHTPHGNVFDGYFSPWKTRLFVAAERRAARWTDRIIELTPGGIDEHLEQEIGRREQFVHIFSGIDLSPYEDARQRREEMRAQFGASDDDFIVGAVGRLEPVKGFTYFMAAAQRISADAPRTRFVLAGDGSLAGELQRQRQRGALNGRMRFLGLRHDVPELMAAFDVLVVPSLNEGMGRVILEAGAAGTPVVASRVGGIPDVVHDGVTGLLVPPRDDDAIAQAVLSLEQDPERAHAMGAAARAHVVPAFSLEQMVMRIEALYEELIEAKRIDSGR